MNHGWRLIQYDVYVVCVCGCRQLFKGWTAIQIWQTRFFDVSPAFVDGCECWCADVAPMQNCGGDL